MANPKLAVYLIQVPAYPALSRPGTSDACPGRVQFVLLDAQASSAEAVAGGGADWDPAALRDIHTVISWLPRLAHV